MSFNPSSGVMWFVLLGFVALALCLARRRSHSTYRGTFLVAATVCLASAASVTVQADTKSHAVDRVQLGQIKQQKKVPGVSRVAKKRTIVGKAMLLSVPRSSMVVAPAVFIVSDIDVSMSIPGLPDNVNFDGRSVSTSSGSRVVPGVQIRSSTTSAPQKASHKTGPAVSFTK